MGDIIIGKREEFEEKKKKILEAGADKFHVLADFDRTLTRCFIGKEKSPPPMMVLRNGKYLTSDYVKKSTALFDKYHPIEIASNVHYEEKVKKMREWWETHFKLLIDTGLNKNTLKRFVKDVKLEFREGTKEFLYFLNKKNIPLVIISSSGLGSVIPMYLEKEGLMYENISVVANLFEFNNKGIVRKVKEPIIHVLNKSEVSLKNLPIYGELEKRKNVMLLGDQLGDLGMVKGFNYDNLISIGFLNENIKENLEIYKKNFDVVIPNDGSFDFINEFLKGFKS